MNEIAINLDEICSYFYSLKKKEWLVYSDPIIAFVYKKNMRINLLTGESENYPIENYQSMLDEKKVFKTEKYEVHHLFYEFGEKQVNLNIREDQYLAIEIQYQTSNTLKLPFDRKKNTIAPFQEITSPIYKKYQKNFSQIIREIRQGKYYQINFTQKWVYGLRNSIGDYLRYFLLADNKIAAMAHFTVVPKLKTLWLSNSPECLFVAQKNKRKIHIDTFPIKGTVSLKGGLQEARKFLTKSKKDKAELDMITDLMRNDLNKIQLPNAKVQRRHFYFRVPNLLQQVSWIRGTFNTKLSLGSLVRALFPGGSITGAPKISAMQSIRQLEDEPRGFYCSSTLLHTKNNCCASINIRSATYNAEDKNIVLNAGGGITLSSTCSSEWKEMQMKKDSFLNIWE